MKRTLFIAALIAAHGLAACATTAPAEIAAPTLDLKRVNQKKYQADLTECRMIANAATNPQVQASTPTEKVKSRVVQVAKAGVKTVARTGVNVVAGAPALVKELSGEGAAQRSRVIVSNCLKGRGYRVLD